VAIKITLYFDNIKMSFVITNIMTS